MMIRQALKKITVVLTVVFCCLLGVSAADAWQTGGGYYCVRFDVGSNAEAFVTGLSANDLGAVQQEITSAYQSGTSAVMEHHDFIDAEKTTDFVNRNGQPDTDAELCWAASASNILHYTGWGKKAGFTNEDYLLEEFIARFDDMPGRADMALKWFFNGWNRMQTTDGWGHEDEGTYGTFTGFLPDYAFEAQAEEIKLENRRDNMALVAEKLQSGYGAALYTGFHTDRGERTGGHGLTLWGYIREKDGAFTHLIYADSDDNYASGGNRRAAPNRMRICKLQLCTWDGEDSWAVQLSEEEGTAQLVERVIALRPYDDAIAAESGGTKNCFTEPDAAALKILMDSDGEPTYYSAEMEELWERSVFSEDDSVSFQVLIANASEKAQTSCDYQLDFYQNGQYIGSIDGEVIWGENGEDGSMVYESGYSQIGGIISFGSQFFSAGEYRVVLTVNPKRQFAEAYYGNNTISRTFTVVESEGEQKLDVTLGEIGEQEDGTFGSFATFALPQDTVNGARYDLFMANGIIGMEEDEPWLTYPWELVYSGATFPETMMLERDAGFDYVIFRLLVKPTDGSGRYTEYRSDAYVQEYRYIKPRSKTATFKNDPTPERLTTENLTARPEGAAAYADGEQTVVNFHNYSTVEGEIAYAWRLCAVHDTTGERYVLQSGESKMVKRLQITEDIVSTSLLADGEPLPAGSYTLYAEAEFVNLAGQTEIAKTKVGTIDIIPSVAQVTTEEATLIDVSGATFAVSAVLNTDQDVRLGIELDTDDSFTDDPICYWLDDTAVVCDGVDVRGERRLTDAELYTNTQYYYRAVLEIAGALHYGETLPLLIPMVWPDPYDIGTVRTVQLYRVGEGVPTVDEIEFSPTESGWYQLRVSGGDCTVALTGAETETFAAKRGSIAESLFLEEGQLYTLRLRANQSAEYSLVVAAVEPTVVEPSIDLPVLTKDGQYTYQAAVSTHVPLGSTFTLSLELESATMIAELTSNVFSRWRTEKASADFAVDLMPMDAVRYRAAIEIGDEKIYTDWQSVTAPMFEGERLMLGTHTFTMRDGERRSFYSLTAQQDGDYVITVDGPNGLLTYYHLAWYQESFTAPVTAETDEPEHAIVATVHLNQGAAAYFMIDAYADGDYTVTVEFVPDEPSDLPGFGQHVLAAYDQNGRMIALACEKTDGGASLSDFVKQHADAAEIKIFRLSDSGAFVPLAKAYTKG
ncbi:MAG: hypothetical protein IJT07_00785 [Oscillospiraceae bacterium]|nr:hypothetical protein [Oscillospiraceae bacterium]